MLASWSVATRIYVGFAIVLALLSALAVFTYASASRVSAIFAEYRATSKQTLYLSSFVEDLYDARMGVMKYREAPDGAAAAEIADRLARIDAETDRRAALFPDDPAARDQLQALAQSAARYADTFEAVEREQEAFDTALAPMVPRAREAGAAIDTLIDIGVDLKDFSLLRLASEAQRDFLLARNHTTKFIDRDDLGELDAARERLSGAEAALSEIAERWSGGLTGDTARIGAGAMADYIAGLERLAVHAEALRRLNQEVLDRIGPEMQAGYVALADAVVDEQNTLGPAATAEVGRTGTTAVVAGLGALVVGLALAWVIGRWIARSVQAMAASMKRMAEGDLDVAVTGDEQRHELGQMAAALKVFRTNGLEKRRLDAEAAEAAERERAAQQERAALQGRVSEVVEKASAGDFSHRVEARFAEETLNQFAGMMNGLLETVSTGVDETVTVMAALARGDLNAAMTGRYSGAFAELQRNVNGTVEKLRATVHDIKASSDQIRTATGEIAQGAGDLSSRAENQAASLEEIAATMEQMSATVKKNAENAVNASGVSAEARARADKGGQVVAEAVTAMGRIEEGSGKIAEIVSVIDGFAFQTNLLALNAAVEAARAGEAGKGFAVVASEVRTLAQRSAEAARDIKGLIQDSSHQVSDGVRLVTETGEALKEIVEAIRKVSDTVTEISEASREQSSGVDEITAAITSMDEITQQNSALADESASAARGLGEQAESLERMMAFFTLAGTGRGFAADWDADAKADTQAAAAVAAE